MLVLTRKRSETIRIGDNVLIKVIRSGRNAVKIGIQAPESVRVLRGELCADAPASTAAPADCLGGETDCLGEEDDLIVACSDQFPHHHTF
jgi:carbon storage regulator